MKGLSTFMSIGMVLVIALVMLIAGVFFVMTVFADAKPVDQIAFGNVEKLRAAIDQACFEYRGAPKEYTVKGFSLPDSRPKFLFQAAANIAINADPQYLLYYENFPPGEAISWETYHNDKITNPRAFGFMGRKEDGSWYDSMTQADIESFVEKTRADVQTNTGKKDFTLVISNVVLSPNLDMLNMEPLSPGGSLKPVSGTVKSKTDNTNGGNTFVLYDTLDIPNKTSVKYFSCGEGNLCVKTQFGVQSFPIDHCSAANGIGIGIDSIEMIPIRSNQGTGGLGVGGAAADLATDLLGEDNHDRAQSNLYLFSPCQPKEIKVKIDTCSCQHVMEYPLYQYNPDSKTFNKISGNRQLCVDAIDNSLLKSASAKPEKCVKIELIDRQDGGCYSQSKVQENAKVVAQDAILVTTELGDHLSLWRFSPVHLPINAWQWPWTTRI
ncbi:MAG TPA: hypothetical protein VI979_00985 [archaeon]|nr:hypothetical protein [archaeon]